MPPPTAFAVTALLHQLLPQSAVLALQQDGVEQAERVVLRRVARRRLPGERERRPRREPVDVGIALLGGLHGLREVRAGRLGTRRYCREVLRDRSARGRRVEVARDHEHGVVRRVVGVEERLRVLERRGIEVCEVAVEIVGIEPVRVRDLRHREPGESAIGLVHGRVADLVLHHALLVLEVRLRDRERLHAVGFGPQHRLQHVRRHDLVVVRVVEARRAVQHAAVALDQADEFHLPEIPGTLEHQVLEQMCEAGAAARLDAKADVVVHADGHGRRRRVARQHDLETVVELVVVDRVCRSRSPVA